MGGKRGTVVRCFKNRSFANTVPVSHRFFPYCLFEGIERQFLSVPPSTWSSGLYQVGRQNRQLTKGARCTFASSPSTQERIVLPPRRHPVVSNDEWLVFCQGQVVGIHCQQCGPNILSRQPPNMCLALLGSSFCRRRSFTPPSAFHS